MSRFNSSLSYAIDALTEQIELGHPHAKQLRKARELVLSATHRPGKPWWLFWRKR